MPQTHKENMTSFTTHILSLSEGKQNMLLSSRSKNVLRKQRTEITFRIFTADVGGDRVRVLSHEL